MAEITATERALNHQDGMDIKDALNRIAAANEAAAAALSTTDKKLFGYRLYDGESDPETRVTYLADNATFAKAYMDYTNGRFVYGGWADAFFLPRPCMLKYDGTVDYYLDPDDYTKKLDGSASNIADTSYGGNAMMEWPKIYVKRVVTDSYYEFYCSNYKADDDFVAWSNYNAKGETNHFYTPIYFGSYDGTRLRSLSGQANMVSQTAATERARAQANGDGWDIETMADRLLICDLLVLMAKTTDTQTAFGGGVNGASAAIAPGTMNAKGLFWGSRDAKTGVKVFGMENWWGNIWRRVVGYVVDKGTQKIKLTIGTQDGSTAEGYNLTGEGYVAISDATPGGSSGGFISKMKNTKFGRLPLTMSGSSTTYECDAAWFNNSIVAVAYFGGVWLASAGVGAFFASVNNTAAAAGADIGAAPSYK